VKCRILPKCRTPSPVIPKAGYSRAVIVDGEWVFVAGTTGFDYTRMTIAKDPAEQARQAFRNIEKALAEAGASLGDIVQVRYSVPDPGHWPALRGMTRSKGASQ
jgi:enamine deaminase RidA (YjgF/YER057c/UK114 family)